MSDRTAWLAERRTGIGASDTAAIMGVSPWSTPYQVWISKLVDIPEDADDEAMWWGSTLETVILDRWADQRDVTYKVRDTLLRSDVFPWLLATPDAVTTDGHPVDAKNSGDWYWDEIPIHYRIQVQHQMIVCQESPVGYLAVLHGGRKLETYEVEWDDVLALDIINATKEFWALVEAEEPPPVEAEDNAMMATLWPQHEEKAVEIPEELADMLTEARAAHKATGETRSLAEAKIKEIMQDADTAVVDQTVIATWKTNKNGTRVFRVRESE